MCGIAAAFGRRNDDWTARVLEMLAKIHYRGDAEHFGEHRSFPTGCMGTNRLAIVDRPGGNPIASHDGRHWIVFNGEIYNHEQLRAELVRSGYGFETTCDTEVVVNGYEHWGVEVLHRLDGQFAFIIFDAKRHHSRRSRPDRDQAVVYGSNG